jgi:resuscitation-promoting factor RpfB
VRKPIKYSFYAAVLAALVAGTIAWTNVDKTVTVSVDGASKRIHTVAGTVRGALGDAGYTVGAHDLVAPTPDASVRNGGLIVLRRGRLLHLSVDGAERDVWTTDDTVGDALLALGYSSSGSSSVSRSMRLPLTATQIDLRLPKLVTVVHDRTTSTAATTAATVGDLLAELNITVAGSDTVSAAPTSAVHDGETVVVHRVSRSQQVRTVPTAYQTSTVSDPAMLKGQTKVVTPGRNGLVRIAYLVVYVDGRLAGKTQLGQQTVLKPVTRLVHVGTKPLPVATPGPAPSGGGGESPAQAQAIAASLLASHGWGQDQMSCLVTMWDHESGWRIDASNPSSGAYGIPQALPGSKMAEYGSDWQTSARTQIEWGLAYIASRYGTPCDAWAQWQANGGWY